MPMYPLNMKSDAGGFAVANDEREHQALTAMGYAPPFAAPQQDTPANPAMTTADEPAGAAPDTVEGLRAALDARGIAYDRRWGLAKLRDALKG